MRRQMVRDNWSNVACYDTMATTLTGLISVDGEISMKMINVDHSDSLVIVEITCLQAPMFFPSILTEFSSRGQSVMVTLFKDKV